MLLALRLCLLILGASAIAIAASILVTGAEATAALAEGVFDTVSGLSLIHIFPAILRPVSGRRTSD